jgi:Flp pilus assembly protein TadD
MRLLSRLLAIFVGTSLLAGCQATETPSSASPLQSRVDTSITEAAAASEKRGDFPNAASYYRSIYERDPDNTEVAIGLSRNLRYLERGREAEAVMERSLRQAPKDKQLLAELGKVQLANDEPAKAVETLSRSLEGTRGNWDVHTALGVGFDRLGLYDQADRHYQMALAEAPDNAMVLNNYGLSLAQRGNLQGAIETLRRAASQIDASAKTRQNLALMYAMSGDLRRAEELVRRDLQPEVADRNMAVYRELAANRRFADAAAVAKAAAAERPDLAPTPGQIAMTPMPAPADAASPAAGKLPSDVARETPAKADSPASATPAEAAKPAPEKPDEPTRMAAKTETASTPIPLTPQEQGGAEEKPAKAEKPVGAEPAASESADAAKPAPAAAGATPYRLQLASFRREAQAEQARELIMTQHKAVLGETGLEVNRINLGSRGDFYRVMSGAMDSRDAAAEMCRVLRERNADCLLVRVDR